MLKPKKEVISMRDQKKADEVAEQRVQIISPLLAEGLDPAQARQIKARICQQTGLSERTLRRYLSSTGKKALADSSPKVKDGEGRSNTD
jgi:putative transposase